MRERQREVQLYRGQVLSPGRPTVAWRQDRVRFWAAIAGGAKTEVAAVEAGVSSPVAFRWFRHAGGVNPCLCPTVWGRCLSSSEREDIALFRAQGLGVGEIARRLGRSASGVSRELRRNASTRTWCLEYKASVAQWHAERRSRRSKPAKLVGNERLRTYVAERLSGDLRDPHGRVLGPQGPRWKGTNKPHRGDRRWVQGWSPQQISNRLRVDFADDGSMRISHEAIYQALCVEGRGALRRELVERTTRFAMLIHLPREHGYGVIARTKNSLARPSAGAHSPKPSTSTYAPTDKPVLRPPIESALGAARRGRDVCHRAALPGHPHRFWHRSRRPPHPDWLAPLRRRSIRAAASRRKPVRPLWHRRCRPRSCESTRPCAGPPSSPSADCARPLP